MAIRYNVKNATDAFNGLAEALDAVSRLPTTDARFWEDGGVRERIITNIINMYPANNKIDIPFKRAIQKANTARDKETETALEELHKGLRAAHEKLTRNEITESEYRAQLADVAASVRGLLADIAEGGVKTGTAKTQKVELVPEQAALLEKTAAGVTVLKRKMIETWKRCNARTRKTTPAENKLCAPMNDALFAHWKAFQRGELDGTISVQAHDESIVERKHKRSADEFWTYHGADVVYTAQDGTQYTVKELCPTVEDVQRMIDRNNKAIKRAEQKNGQSADKKKI